MYPMTIGDYVAILKYLEASLKLAKDDAERYKDAKTDNEQLRIRYVQWKQQADDDIIELNRLIRLIKDREVTE